MPHAGHRQSGLTKWPLQTSTTTEKKESPRVHTIQGPTFATLHRPTDRASATKMSDSTYTCT